MEHYLTAAAFRHLCSSFSLLLHLFLQSDSEHPRQLQQLFLISLFRNVFIWTLRSSFLFCLPPLVDDTHFRLFGPEQHKCRFKRKYAQILIFRYEESRLGHFLAIPVPQNHHYFMKGSFSLCEIHVSLLKL